MKGRATRRQLLRAGGAAGLLFPFLRPRAASALPPTPRLVLLMQSNGTHAPAFWPAPADPGAGTGGQPLLSPILAPLLGSGPDEAGLAAKTTVVRGLHNEVGGAGNPHDHGFCGLYSGFRSVGTFNDPWGGGISLDQLLARTLSFTEPFPTLNCGVLASDAPAMKTHRRSFSYTAARKQVPADYDPYRLYARYFALGASGAGTDPAAGVERRLRQRRSVLDHAREDLRLMRLSLGRLDRDKLEAHEGALRELERQLGATLAPPTDRPAACAAPAGPPAGLDPRAEDNVPALITLMLDFIALVVSCQLTRIVTFQFGHGGEQWYFRWLGINENSHGDIAHRDDGRDPAVSLKSRNINVWYAQQVAHLARALDRLPEGEGTVLDNSLVVWGNEMASGSHGMKDIPLVLLGRAAGRLKNAGALVDAGPQDYHRLGTTLLNVMGLPATGFGEAQDCGPLAGVSL